MANRHLCRSIVMQSLFEWDFGGCTADLEEIVKRNAAEFAPGIPDTDFMVTLAQGIADKRAKIDEVIVAAAPEWPIEKIAVLNRTILRIGLFELLFGDRKEVPPKVAINEAIELAKSFGGDSGSRFVNGVLGAVYREMGEPGKDQTSKKKEPIDITKLPIDRLIGAVVYTKTGNGVKLALLRDVFGKWTLTKGHLKDEETDTDGVVRKALDEMGAVIIEVKDLLGENEYLANTEDGGKLRKQVRYFLAEAKDGDLRPGESGGIADAKWFTLPEVIDLTMYDDILPIVTKGVNILLGKSS
ncbi:MAG: transcription antitermination factor NusB [Candidatus Yonathbacteria bacterium]|nr:transcription antitermination factor NusB [Candidatus Yonathbacteria bacterium]NTW47778.1 transcription antitermination factor NusB [Candidatus Yonathbacteria bacterium]